MGGAPGYIQSTYVQQGMCGGLNKQSTLTYTAHTASADNGGATIYPIASSTVYRNSTGLDLGPETTTYTYTSWWTKGMGDTNQVKSVTVNPPTVPMSTPPPDIGQNGPGAADVDTTFLDVYGRPTWHRNSINPPDNLTADGYIDYTEYDQATGAVVKTIDDVDTTKTGDFQNLPVDPHTGLSWATPAGGGLHLKTIMQVDGLGRTIRTVTPNATVSLSSGNVIDIVYDDLNHAVRTYTGWNENTHLPTGPIQVVQEVRPVAGSMNPLFTQTLTMSASPLNPVTWATSSDMTYTYPTGMESIAAIQSLSRNITNGSGQVVEMDTYFYLDSLAYSANPYLGTVNTNYYATLYSYDQQGRRYKTQSPTNTITETDYDTLGRVTQTQIGTVGTAMTIVSQNQYDGGNVGDSNLTQRTDYPSGSGVMTDQRVTQNYYDWRDRQVASKQGVQMTENDGTHRPIITWAYDNLNEVVTQEQYDGDGVTPQISGGVLVALPEADRRARTTTLYDNQQRVYRANTFNVVQSGANAGTLLPSDASPYTLTTNTWYDHRGNVIKVSQPGGQATKTTYDGANRAIVVHTSDDIAMPTWSDAGSVANNNVLTQTETTYDKNGNAILVIERDRFHDDPVGGTGLGELGTPTMQPKARVSYVANYYDLADRLTDRADVGTNGGVGFIRLSSPPPRSDTALVTSYSYLADAVQTVTLTGAPTGGTFTLTFNSATTQGINFNAASTEVQSKIQAILITGQTVLVTGPAGGAMTAGGPWLVRFVGSLAGSDQPNMTGNGSGLTGGTMPAVAVITTYRGGDSGRVQTMTDPRGLITKTDFDLKGRTAETIQAFAAFDPSNSYDQTTRYTYDGSNHVVTLTALLPGNVQQQTQYTYGVTISSSKLNSNELLGSITYPNNGLNNDEHFTYNALGQMATKTERNLNANLNMRQAHAYSYDVLGRQTSDTATVIATGEDDTVQRLDTAYDTGDRPYLYTSYSDVGGTMVVNQVQQVYNGLSQLITEYQSHSGPVNTMTTPKVQYAYSEMSGGANHSRLISMTYPSGRILHYGYNSGLDDSISRLSFLADDNGMGGIGTHLEDESYLGLSTVIKRSHPLAAGTLDLTYIGTPGDAGDQYAGLDRFGRVVDQHWINTNTSTVTDDFTYSYDRDGNRLSRNNTVNTAFNEQYTGMSGVYDPLNRMTGFSRGSHSQSWNLDALGNWTTLTTDGTQTQTRSFNLQNQITSISGATTPVYDGNGNTLLDEKGNQYTYDAWNRLTQVVAGATTVHYGYDALGRRISTQVGSANPTDLYYSASWQVVEERVSGAMTAQYVWSPVYVDALVERDTSGGPRLYVQQDANWNVTAIADATGAVKERYVYDPYGQPTFLTPTWTVLSSSAFSWVYLHQGGRFDTVSGLYYFRNRDYSPTLGRWMQEDPIGFSAGDSNLYGYVASEPTGKTDPLGLWLPPQAGYLLPPTGDKPSMEGYVGKGCAVACVGSWNSAKKAAWEAYRAGKQASKNKGLVEGSTRDRAFRHCVASGYLATLVGCQCAECIGTQREDWQTKYDEQSQHDHDQGIANNRKGLGVAGCYKPTCKRDGYTVLTPGAGGYADKPYNGRFPSLATITKNCEFDLDHGRLDLREPPKKP